MSHDPLTRLAALQAELAAMLAVGAASAVRLRSAQAELAALRADASAGGRRDDADRPR